MDRPEIKKPEPKKRTHSWYYCVECEHKTNEWMGQGNDVVICENCGSDKTYEQGVD